MAQFRWRGFGAVVGLWSSLRRRVEEEWFVFRLTFYSLFYNSFTSFSTVADTLMEPMFWFVDHFIRYLGPVFVVVVVFLTTSVVVIFYVCLLPHKMANGYAWTAYHLIFGHWLLVNIVFHYFKAAFTDPGHPPAKISESVAICKKCISPKPPRTHHCSICGKCVLKMDHHCPWLNNCVGHFNHRHFFLFCFYMWVGCCYVSISAYSLFKVHFYGSEDVGWPGIFYPFYILKHHIQSVFSASTGDVATTTRRNGTNGAWFHGLILFEFLLCSAATVALGALLLWNVRLVHYAETNIEVHTNRLEAKRHKTNGLIYRNPYDFGPARNWKLFLGLTYKRSFFWHVLLPSSHPPDEDGLKWRSVYTTAETSGGNPEGILLL